MTTKEERVFNVFIEQATDKIRQMYETALAKGYSPQQMVLGTLELIICHDKEAAEAYVAEYYAASYKRKAAKTN